MDRAEAAERQAIRIRPNWGWAYRHLGFILSNKGDSDGALAAHRRAFRLDPSLTSEATSIREILTYKGDYEAMLEDSRTLLEREPDNPYAHEYLGLALWGQGNIQGSFAAWRDALQLYEDPSRGRLRDIEGRLRRDEGTPDNEAIRQGNMARILAFFPGHPIHDAQAAVKHA